ncbi:macro domain-containing protein [Singulisphaera sp. PoT]|uniref:macro domain-containing protein n=1 Tax=Singulisphaera sp. PoT TaxID=3411797 RepID=UPI003BF4A482
MLKPFGRGVTPELLRISFSSLNPEVSQALAARFHETAAVEVLVGDLLELDCDALVSPANSFGDMSGGFDQQIDLFYREEAQRATMGRIAERFHGELPVGLATILSMSSRRFPFLVVAPTMRVPSRVFGTINAYLSMRAALVAIRDHNASGLDRKIRSVAVPGLCTGVGGMPADEASMQMKAAYDMIELGGWKQIGHPIQAPFALEPRKARRDGGSSNPDIGDSNRKPQ